MTPASVRIGAGCSTASFMHFDLVDLRLMIRVAEANSLTRIKNLEESVGTKLLYRTSQGVTLTPAGQAFVHHARAVLAQLENLTGDLQEYAKGIKGHLRIAGSTTALSESAPLCSAPSYARTPT